MTRDRAVKEIRSSAFAPDALRIERTLRPQIALLPSSDPGGVLRPGASRFGGVPDVPPGFEWPRYEGRPLHFLAQLDLASFAGLGVKDWLPLSGSLLFFYDAATQPWGFDPRDGGGTCVLHLEEPLQRATVPHGIDVFPAHAILPELRYSIPDLYDDAAPLGVDTFTEDESEAWTNLRDLLRGHQEPCHHLLGWADLVQNDMKLQAQLASNGVYAGSAEDYVTPRARSLAHGAAEWRLLLQLDSDDALEWMWGDAGTLYFWIRDRDLRAANFSDVWAVLQSI